MACGKVKGETGGECMLNFNHKKLDVWKMSVSFVTMIYELTRDFPKSEVYGITNQLRRAAVSIPSNIAEGASRDSAKDKKRFYEIAWSSLVEIDTQLEISKRLNYVNTQTNSEYLHVEEMMNSLFATLTKLKERTN